MSVVAIGGFCLFALFHVRDALDDVAMQNAQRAQDFAHELELRLAEKDLGLAMIAQTTGDLGLEHGAQLMATYGAAEHLGRIIAVDGDGIVRADNRPDPPAFGLDMSDRDYFRRFADDAEADELFIGAAIRNRTNDELVFTLARPARDVAGALVAVHATAIAPWIIANVMTGARLGLDGGEQVLIARGDGDVLIRIDEDGMSAPIDPDWSPTPPRNLDCGAEVSGYDIAVSLCAPHSVVALRAAQAAAPGGAVALALLAMALLVIRMREDRVLRRAAARERERERVSQLLELSGHRFYEIDPDGVCVVARGAWSNGDPVDPERYVGQAYADIRKRINDAGSDARIASALDARRPFSRLLVTVVSPDGEHGQAALSGAPLWNDSEFLGWRIVAFDVTEPVRAAELKTALDTKTRLIAAVSHDMRQPIQALMLFLGVARESATDPKAREMIERATSIAGNLVRQIGALADLGRVESEMIRPHLVHTDIRPLLERAAAEQAAIAAARGVEVRTVLPEAEVVTDPMLLERVVDNILNNAVKFARSRVLIGARRHGPHFLIEIMDDGPGVAPDHREDIFHAWERRDVLPRRGVEGTGIGLAVSRQIAEALGVAIRLKSRPGRGARFTLELHAEPDPQTVQRHPARHDVATVVMAVDDDPAIRAALTAALTTDSRTVFAYPSGEAALAADLDGLEPDAFVVDLNLGDGMDGGQLIRTLMARPRGKAPAYFVLSGEPPDVVERLLGDLPVRAVLRKPIRLDDLQTAIDAATAPSR